MIVKFDSIIEVITPLHTGGNEKTGSTPILRTVFIQTPHGEIPLPYVNGNSVRGKLRRMLMRDFLYLLGISPEEIGKTLYHALFSGGILENTGDTEQVIDLEFRKTFRTLIPPVSLFGCAYANQMIAGKMKVSHLFPICLEYYPFLPEEVQKKIPKETVKSIRVYTDEVFFTRRDDLKIQRKEDEQAVQMKVDYEVFVPGTKFYSFFILEYPTEIELSCFARMIRLWSFEPYVGARSGIGDGMIKFNYDIKISDEGYIKYVEQNKKDIIDFIRKL